MKSLTILEDVAIPGMPAFKKGAEVRVSDVPRERFEGKSIAEVLLERGHAKEVKGALRSDSKTSKNKKNKDDVQVKKTG